MIIQSEFRAPWWLRNRHLQTIWAGKIRRPCRLATEQIRLKTPDDDFLDLAITNDNGGPVVLVLHGLQGSIESRYAGGLLSALAGHGYTAALMHFRSCSGELNSQPRLYHSGETGDALFVADCLAQRFSGRTLAAVGFSLGGNVLLKLLGELQARSSFAAAVAVSVPMRLDLCADRINRGLSKIYQYMLVNSMKKSVLQKYRAGQFNHIDMQKVRRARTFWDFDDAYTAPMHGFKNVHDYYQRCSSRQFLKYIQTPTLILHAADDPFTSNNVIPEEHELPDSVRLEISLHGGHVGFVHGKRPWRAKYWIEERVLEFFADNIKSGSSAACK
jgi:hypothetical protein